jgi:hypothetical protein
MQEMPAVNVLNPLNHLVGKHEHGLKTKLSFAVVEKILKRGSKQIDNHYIVISFDSKPVDVRDSDSSLKNSVELRFIKQLRVLGPNWLL